MCGDEVCFVDSRLAVPETNCEGSGCSRLQSLQIGQVYVSGVVVIGSATSVEYRDSVEAHCLCG